MSFEAVIPLLRTRDLPRAVAFYVDVLGFGCEALDDVAGWASLARDGVSLMLALPNAQHDADAPVFTGSLYFRVDDVDALWITLRDRARVCYPPETFPYGMREFAVYDEDGYLLQFGRPVDEEPDA